MKAALKDRALLECAASLTGGVDHARHVARLATDLMKRSAHVNGLTKAVRPALRTLAMLHEAEGEHKTAVDAALEASDLPLDGETADLVRRGLECMKCETGEGQGQLLGVSADPLDVMAWRMAALCRVACALDWAEDQSLEIVRVIDREGGLEIQVSPGPEACHNAGAAMEKAMLWNSVMPVSIRSVGLAVQQLQPVGGLLLGEQARGMFYVQLEQCLSRLFALSHTQDPEVVHEMRVALRRFRAALRFYKGLFSNLPGDLNQRLKHYASILGDVRDADVFIAWLETHAEGAGAGLQPLLWGLVESEKAHRAEAEQRAVEAFGDVAFADFVMPLRRMLRAPLCTEGSLRLRKKARGTVAERAPKMLRAAVQKVRKKARPLTECGPDDLHRLRIRFKRLRYAAECVGEAWPDGLAPLIQEAKDMQDYLGEVHDCDVYAARVMRWHQQQEGYESDLDLSRSVGHLLKILRQDREKNIAAAASLWETFLQREEMIPLL